MNRPLIFCVGGEKSNVGKTTIAAAIVRGLASEYANIPPLRFFKPPLRIGAIKYTKTAFYTSVTSEPRLVRRPDKDTAIYAAAGAEPVFWIQSPAEELKDVLARALEMLADRDLVIVEGNSPIEFLRPDGIIFVTSSGRLPVKPSALEARKKADLVVFTGEKDDGEPIPGISGIPVLRFSRRDNLEEFDRIMIAMDEITARKQIATLLKERSADGRISCTAARGIAEELAVPYALIGAVANELKLKIKHCELGCF
ncbi:MAG TPA: hypothetical protein VK445_10000 [Dissulfurispiraceae bacterium]|nr:hypothetical protein [Dissulfurispiraceae bacterium]